MTFAELLTALDTQGYSVSVTEANKLRVAPADMSHELQAAIKQHKRVLVAKLLAKPISEAQVQLLESLPLQGEALEAIRQYADRPVKEKLDIYPIIIEYYGLKVGGLN
jgi:hypothetical protein